MKHVDETDTFGSVSVLIAESQLLGVRVVVFDQAGFGGA